MTETDLPNNSSTDRNLAHDTAQANRAIGTTGQSDMVWGHVSVRDPEGRGIWMKSAGWSFEKIDDEKVVLVTPHGDVLAGTGRRHIEYPLHTEIMRARPGVNCVVHTHSVNANAFASLGIPMRPLSHDAIPFVNPD